MKGSEKWLSVRKCRNIQYLATNGITFNVGREDTKMEEWIWVNNGGCYEGCKVAIWKYERMLKRKFRMRGGPSSPPSSWRPWSPGSWGRGGASRAWPPPPPRTPRRPARSAPRHAAPSTSTAAHSSPEHSLVVSNCDIDIHKIQILKPPSTCTLHLLVHKDT